METNNTNFNNSETPAEVEITQLDDKLLAIYDQLTAEEDIAVMLAEYLGSVTSFNYGLVQANVVNDRQGKNRTSYSSIDRKLMKFDETIDFDAVANEKALELAAYVINVLLSDKQEIPNKPRLAASISSYVKTVYIMILVNELYDLLPKLNTPSFVSSYVESFTEDIHEQQEIIFNEWVSFVEDNESLELADYTRDLGYQYWSTKSPSGTLFESRYRKYITQMTDFTNLRNNFVTFRARYQKVTRSLEKEFVMEIFEITKGQFDAARKKVMSDIQELTEIDDQAITLKLLIYGR